MAAPTERLRPETSPKQPLVEIQSWNVSVDHVTQMAGVIGGKMKFLEPASPVPYLVHPLGITIRFGESDPASNTDGGETRISIDPARRAFNEGAFNTQGITAADIDIKIYDDAVVFRQHGHLLINGEVEEIIDELKLTKDDYSYTRQFTYPKEH